MYVSGLMSLIEPAANFTESMKSPFSMICASWIWTCAVELAGYRAKTAPAPLPNRSANTVLVKEEDITRIAQLKNRN